MVYALLELKKNQNAVDFWHHTFKRLDIKSGETEMVEDGHDCLLQCFDIDFK
ncbi:MAG: hypothetical protein JEZ08_07530 [Clostridiales bacterium]|nr:hypothetical protein [Clostridiales bacterium]